MSGPNAIIETAPRVIKHGGGGGQNEVPFFATPSSISIGNDDLLLLPWVKRLVQSYKPNINSGFLEFSLFSASVSFLPAVSITKVTFCGSYRHAV